MIHPRQGEAVTYLDDLVRDLIVLDTAADPGEPPQPLADPPR